MSYDESSLSDGDGGFAARVRSAVFWRWGSQVVAQLITWTATIVVVRLLNPHDYGLFAMTQAVLTALNFLNGYSFATSLIQAREVDERRIRQVFGLLILANVILATIQFAMAPLAAAYYSQPLVAEMLRIQALVFLATPFIALPSSLLARRLDFRRQAIANLICALAGAATALGLALSGAGVWALVWAPIVMFATRAVALTVAAGGLVRPLFDFTGARDIIGFGTALTLCQLFWIIQSQADIVIAGRSFSPHELGIYSESLFLALIFTGRFLPPLNEIAFPAYSELVNSGKPVGPAFVNAIRMIMLACVPFYAGLYLVADPLIETFFGPKWQSMTPVFSGLAITMPAMSLQIACSPATNALGRPRIYLASAAAGAVIMPVAFALGVNGGTMGLVHAWQIAAPLLMMYTLSMTLPALGVSWKDLCLAIAPSLGSAAAMALAVLAVTSLVADHPAWLRLMALSSLGAMVYFSMLMIVSRKRVFELITFVSARRLNVA